MNLIHYIVNTSTALQRNYYVTNKKKQEKVLDYKIHLLYKEIRIIVYIHYIKSDYIS